MIARVAPRLAARSPDLYEAEGVLVIVGRTAILEDQAGARWPLGVLLRELAGRAVRLRVEVARGGEEGGR